MVDDARVRTTEFLDTYLDPDNITRDDDSSVAGFQIMYDKPDYPLTLELKDPSVTCVVFSIRIPNSTAEIGHDQKPVGYTERVPITITTTDKAGVTGTLVLAKAHTELRRISELHSTGSQRSLGEMRPKHERLGSHTLYSIEAILIYRRGLT